jgi:hypothetical protein
MKRSMKVQAKAHKKLIMNMIMPFQREQGK